MSKLAPGVRVRITAGLAAGVEAVVVARWEGIFQHRTKVAQWRLRSDDLVRDRVIREDFLEVLP